MITSLPRPGHGEPQYEQAIEALKEQKSCGETLVKQLVADIDLFHQYLGSSQGHLNEAAFLQERTASEELEHMRGNHANEIEDLQRELRGAAETHWSTLQEGLQAVQGELSQHEIDALHIQKDHEREVSHLQSKLLKACAEREKSDATLVSERSFFEVQLSNKQGQVEILEQTAIEGRGDVEEIERGLTQEIAQLHEEFKEVKYTEETVRREKDEIVTVLGRLRAAISQTRFYNNTSLQDGETLERLETKCCTILERLDAASNWLNSIFPTIQGVLHHTPHHQMDNELAKVIAHAEDSASETAHMQDVVIKTCQEILARARDAVFASAKLEAEVSDYARVFFESSAIFTEEHLEILPSILPPPPNPSTLVAMVHSIDPFSPLPRSPRSPVVSPPSQRKNPIPRQDSFEPSSLRNSREQHVSFRTGSAKSPEFVSTSGLKSVSRSPGWDHFGSESISQEPVNRGKQETLGQLATLKSKLKKFASAESLAEPGWNPRSPPSPPGSPWRL